MIEDGWLYIWAAYALAGGALLALAVVVGLHLARWSKRARQLEERRP